MTSEEHKKIEQDIKNQYAALLANEMTKNVQEGTDEVIKGLAGAKNVALNGADFAQKKGNLFEYIEAVKYNRNAANAGADTRAVVTAAVGRPHDAADIEIIKNGRVIEKVQAKASESASKSVAYQAGLGKSDNKIYDDMQRLIVKEKNYNADGSMLDEARKLAGSRADSGGIYAQNYKDVYENLTDELKGDGISSGGTSISELKAVNDNPDKYIRNMEFQQLSKQFTKQAATGAVMGGFTSAIVSGAENFFNVLSDKKELSEALADIGASAVKGGARTGGTMGLASIINFFGKKNKVPVISDGMSATIIAGGAIDFGVAIYNYAKGEIDSDQLCDELVNTVVKSTATVYFTKAINAVLPTTASGLFLPMAIYSVAGIGITAAHSIIKNAKLNAEEYKRIAAILDENTMLMKEYHNKLNAYMQNIKQENRRMMSEFMISFNYDYETGENYEQAVCSLITFANRAGVSLKYAEFEEFENAMKTQDNFVF